MSLFQLDPASLAARAGGGPVPGLAESLRRGVCGFTVVSVAGFAPWALFGRWFYRHVGEVGLYVVCAAVFIAASGPALHRLILGPGTLGRFYGVWVPAFAVYAVGWTLGWIGLRGHEGSLWGLGTGAILMSAVLVGAFGARGALLPVWAALFAGNVLGYFSGGFLEAALIGARGWDAVVPPGLRITAAKLLWGVCYGLGFGAALGFAFWFCQREARRRLAIPSPPALPS